jgi:plastocyanin
VSGPPRPSLLPLFIVAGAIALAVLVAIPVAFLVANGDAGEDGRDATPTVIDAHEATIEIEDFAFAPPNVSVPLGTRITWLNRDAALHDATDDGGAWQTERLGNGDSDSVTFDTPGTFDYHCSIHPYMKARITVRPD